MKGQQYFYTSVFLIVTTLGFVFAGEDANIKGNFENYSNQFKLKRILETWNRSSDNFQLNTLQDENPNFASGLSNCIENSQYQIAENISQGKAIILNCFKTTLILNALKYLGGSPKSSVKLFNGFLEFEKITNYCEKVRGDFEENNNCSSRYGRHLSEEKRNQYLRMYKKAMLKLISERNRLKAQRNQTEEEREKLLSRIKDNSEAFMSEVIASIGNEGAEEAEEEVIKQEVTDPKLLAVLDEVSKSYLLRLRFYPGMAARMMRSHNGGFTFDLEIEEPSEEEENEEDEVEGKSSDESSTREIKDGPQFKDYDDEGTTEDDDSNRIKKKKGKGNKNKKKQKKKKKKKAKKLKKIIPYLLIPIMIQMTLLPFVFKKLFFLAMKALFAGKVALILVGFNLLRNTCIKNDDDFQKIRVEHYGYRRGEEYGAWVNGRSFQNSLIMSVLNEGFFDDRKHVAW